MAKLYTMYICTATFLSTCLLMGTWVVSIYLLNFCCGNPRVHGRMNIQTLYTCNGVSSFLFFLTFFLFFFTLFLFSFSLSFFLPLSLLLSLHPSPSFSFLSFSFLKDFIYLFLVRWEGEKEREGNVNVRQKY